MEQRSRPTRPLASFGEGSVGLNPNRLLGFGFITIVLVSMSFLLCGGLGGLRLGGGVLREESVERGDGLIDVFARDEKGGRKRRTVS